MGLKVGDTAPPEKPETPAKVDPAPKARVETGDAPVVVKMVPDGKPLAGPRATRFEPSNAGHLTATLNGGGGVIRPGAIPEMRQLRATGIELRDARIAVRRTLQVRTLGVDIRYGGDSRVSRFVRKAADVATTPGDKRTNEGRVRLGITRLPPAQLAQLGPVLTALSASGGINPDNMAPGPAKDAFLALIESAGLKPDANGNYHADFSAEDQAEISAYVAAKLAPGGSEELDAFDHALGDVADNQAAIDAFELAAGMSLDDAIATLDAAIADAEGGGASGGGGDAPVYVPSGGSVPFTIGDKPAAKVTASVAAAGNDNAALAKLLSERLRAWKDRQAFEDAQSKGDKKLDAFRGEVIDRAVAERKGTEATKVS